MQQNKKNTLLRIFLVLLLVCTALLCTLPALAQDASGEPGYSGTSSYNEADGNKIESIHLVWNTEDTRDDGDEYFLWLSTSSRSNLSMKFTLQVNLSGQAEAGDYAPGSLRIRIPQQIWHARDTQGEDGSVKEEGYGKMDLPITIKPTPSVDWYYEVDGDDYVLVNNKQIGATSNHSFECTIYNIDPLYIVDESISDELVAHIDAVTSAGNTIWMDSNTLVAQIDTQERITNAAKSAKFFEFIDDDEGVPQAVLDHLPSGTPEDYVYVKWTNRAYMSGNQYFSLSMDDPETWCYDRVYNEATGSYDLIPVCQGIFLAQLNQQGQIEAALGDEPVPGEGQISADGYSYHNDLVVDYYYSTQSPPVILWAAYPNETFQNAHTYVFQNSADWDLLEQDPEVEYWEKTDVKQHTEADAADSVSFLQMDWVYPPGRFLSFKYIESNMPHTHPYYSSSAGTHHKEHTYEMALNHLRNGEDVTMDYEVLTVGYGYMFTAGPLANEVSWEDGSGRTHTSEINAAYNDNWNSEEWIQDPDHFLNWYYVMDTADRWDFFQYVDRAGGDPQLTGEDYQFDGVYIQAPEMFNYSRVKNSSYRFTTDLPFGYTVDNAPEKKPTVQLWVEYDNSATVDKESPTGQPEGWVYMGEYSVTEGCLWVPFDNTTEKGIVTGYRTRVTTNEAACKLTVYPRITLKATERVQGMVEQLFAESSTPSTNFRNDENLHVELFKTAEDQSIYDPIINPDGKVYPNQQMFLDEDVYFRKEINEDSAIAKFTGAGYGISLTKSVSFDSKSIENGGDNDIINKRAILHYTATCTQRSNLTSLPLYNEAVEGGAVVPDYSCVWYDLLPENVQPMLDTVRMARPGDKILRVSTIPDYEGTGRIMMIVECELKPDPHYISRVSSYGDEIILRFDAYITWLDLNSMPENFQFTNYVAYESGIEGQVGTIKGQQGEKDTITPAPKLNGGTPTGVPQDIANAFTDLDPNTDDGRFVYARVSVSPHVNMDAHTEYVKYVSNDLEGIWTQGLSGQTQVNVYEGHNYTYRLTVSSAKGTNTWDMVFYDSIENYLIPSPDPDDPMQDASKAEDYAHTRDRANWQGDWQEGVGGAPGGQWRGRLYQVDLSELQEMGCDPILYYSTIPWMQFSDTYGDVVNEDVIFNDAAGHYMLEDPTTWTQVDRSAIVDGKWNVPDGLDVTAIAVDATTTTDGESFVLRSKESVSFELHMTAPDDDGEEGKWGAKGAYAHITDEATGFDDIDWEAATDPENNMRAYNNTRLISRQAHEDDSSAYAFLTMIRNDYTRVGILPEICIVEKVWDDDDDHDALRPDSIVVEMMRKVQLAPGDYEPVLDANGDPVTLEIAPVTVTETINGEVVEREEWKGIFYQVPVVDEQGRKYLYQFRDTVTGYTCSCAEGENGIYVLTNTHENETIPIKGEKTWLAPDGSALPEEAEPLVPASIKVHLYRTGASGEAEFVKTLTVSPDNDGKWIYDFGQQEKYERGGFEYQYFLKEDPVEGFFSSLEDVDTLPPGYEIPYLTDAAFDPDRIELFHNFYLPFGDLSVQKNLIDATDVSSQQAFTFTLSFFEADDPTVPVGGQYAYSIYTVETDQTTGEETLVTPAVSTGTVSDGSTVSLLGGQRLVVAKLPAGIGYSVSEAGADGWNVPATPEDAGEPGMENTTGNILSGQTAEAVFTNTYSASGYAQVGATKHLTGRELKNAMFTFELVDMNEGSETYGEVLRTASNKAPTQTEQNASTGVITSTAEVLFGALDYDQSDAGQTFHYQVREKDTGKPGVTYSTQTFDVTVEVTDNGDGTLSTVVTPSDPAQMVFENIYEAEGELQLRGWKAMTRRDPEDGEFHFELWLSNESGQKLQKLQTVTNDAEGNVVFAPIVFDETMVSVDTENPFVYHYLMVEKDTGNEDIIYSDYQHLFIVTPQDNGNGTISFVQTEAGFDGSGAPVDRPASVFTNDEDDGHLKLTKLIENGNPSTRFNFKVKLNGVSAGDFDLEFGGATNEDYEAPEQEEEVETPSTASGIKPVYYAPAADMTGTAYAALNKQTGELVFFRTDPNAPMDPWGNTFRNNGFSGNRQASADGNFIWYNNVESGTHAWTSGNYTSERNAIKTVTMRDPIRPSSLSYFFQDCTNLVSVSLDKMDLHDANGTTRQASWLYGTFSGTPNIREIDLGTLDLSKTGDLQYAFRYCNSLETLNIGHLARAGSALSSKAYQDYAFQSAPITCITIGDRTTFSRYLNNGFYYQYPTPPSGYEDKWVNVDTGEELASVPLFTEGNHGGTWVLDPKYYNLAFDANGGSGSMATKHLNVHTSYTTGHSFYRYGYTLSGFSDDYGNTYSADASGRITVPSNVYKSLCTDGVEPTITLHAQWQPVDSSATIEGEVISISLYGNESVTISNIPAHTSYEVWEELPTGWVLVSKVNDTGVIESNVTSEVEFTNKYAPNLASISLRAIKRMDGVLTGGYTFQLYKADANWNPVGDPIETKVTDDSGVASFAVLHFDETMVGTNHYIIKEVVPDPADPDIVYDTEPEKITILVSDDGEGNISAVSGYHVDGGTFRNYTKPGSLTIRKQIVDEALASYSYSMPFTVRVTFYDAAGQPADPKFNGETLDSLTGTVHDANGSTRTVTGSIEQGQMDITLYGGETIVFADVVPAGYSYKIEEINIPAGWTLTETDGQLEGTTTPAMELEVSFTNTYRAQGKVPLTVEKMLEGETPEAGAYTFEVYPYQFVDPFTMQTEDLGYWNGEELCPVEGAQPVMTATNSASDSRETVPLFRPQDTWLTDVNVGTAPDNYADYVLHNAEYGASLAQFGDLTLTKQGYHIYAIREVPGDDPTVIYDDRVIYARVTAVDGFGNGELICPMVEYFYQEPGMAGPVAIGVYSYPDYTDPNFGPLSNQLQYMPVLYARAYFNMLYYPIADGQVYHRAFINERKNGSLLIGKEVTGATEAADGTEFTITVTLTDKNGELLAGETYQTLLADGTEGTVTTDASGMATLTLQDGQTIEVLGLPHGAAYVVSETDLPGGFTMESVNGGEGTIVGDEQSEATVHNRYEATGELSLTAKKIMTPEGVLTLEEGRFTFQLLDDRGKVVRSAVNGADGTVSFEPIPYTMADVGQTYVYKVNESTVDNFILPGESSIYATDSTVYTVAVTVSDNGQGGLETQVEMLKAEEAVDLLLFANTERTSVTVTKTWNDQSNAYGVRPRFIVLDLYADGEFNCSRAVSAERYATDDENVWSYTFENLPKYNGSQLITYTVVEQPVEYYYPVVTGSGYSYAIVNTYSETTMPLSGVKTLTDHLTGETVAVTDGQFSFAIAGESGTEPLPEEPTAAVRSDGTFAFGDITFTLADLAVDEEGHYVSPSVLTYQVSEVIPEGVNANNILPDTHMRYDGTVHQLKVTLTYDVETGTLTAVPDLAPSDIAFANIANADKCQIVLTAQKNMVNRSVRDEEFIFHLMRDGEVIDTAANDAEGLITFETIILSAEDLGDAEVVNGQRTGTVTFTITEENAGINGIIYDEDVETVTVTLVENVDGTFSASADRSGDQRPVFENTMEVTEFTVTKVWEGGGGAIELTLYANDQLLDPQPSYSRDGDTYTYTGLPKYSDTGEFLVYSAKETYMEGFMTIYSNTADHEGETDRVYDGGTILNRALIKFRVQKKWYGLPEYATPPKIRLLLFCNGEEIKKATPEPDENGWYVYTLPKYHNGEEAVYYVREVGMEGFVTHYTDLSGQTASYAYNGYKIHNEKLPHTGDRTPVAALSTLILLAGSSLCLMLKKRRKS